jgi:hypothetical protein
MAGPQNKGLIRLCVFWQTITYTAGSHVRKFERPGRNEEADERHQKTRQSERVARTGAIVTVF